MLTTNTHVNTDSIGINMKGNRIKRASSYKYLG